jgi:hypothetical protein
VRPAQQEQQRECRSEELGEVDQGMLIPWMNAMLGKIRRFRVVKEVVEGSNDWVSEGLCEVELARGIKRCVNANGKESCGDSERSEEDE